MEYSQNVLDFCEEHDLNPDELDESIIDAIDNEEEVYICAKCGLPFLEEDIRECPKCERMLCKFCFGGFYESEECADCVDSY